MDEMLMDQVMAVSNGTSRVCVNEEKYEPATVRGLPADLVKKSQARETTSLRILESGHPRNESDRSQDLWYNRKDRERRLQTLNTLKVTSCREWEQTAVQTREKVTSQKVMAVS